MNPGDPAVRVIRPLDTDRYPWCTDAVLIEVQNGRGVLWRATKAVSGETYENDQAIMVNDVPIIRSQGPVCPTCERMLATGYGLERAESGELRQIADAINEPYRGFEDAVGRIVPVLGLLADGLYALTAFRTLDAYHDDEVDQLFIDELVANDDRSDPVRQIADRHWAEV